MSRRRWPGNRTFRMRTRPPRRSRSSTSGTGPAPTGSGTSRFGPAAATSNPSTSPPTRCSSGRSAASTPRETSPTGSADGPAQPGVRAGGGGFPPSLETTGCRRRAVPESARRGPRRCPRVLRPLGHEIRAGGFDDAIAARRRGHLLAGDDDLRDVLLSRKVPTVTGRSSARRRGCNSTRSTRAPPVEATCRPSTTPAAMPCSATRLKRCDVSSRRLPTALRVSSS